MTFSREWISLVERDPVAAMRRFVSGWYAPLRPDEGVPEAELATVRTPDALVALFRLAGRSLCGAPYQVMGECPASSLGAAVAPLSRLPLAPWHWPAYPGEFWAGEGVCVFSSPLNDEYSYVSAGAIVDGRLEWLSKIGVEWDSTR